MSLYVRRLPVEDHAVGEVVRDDEVLLSCPVRKGKARQRERGKGSTIPHLGDARGQSQTWLWPRAATD